MKRKFPVGLAVAVAALLGIMALCVLTVVGSFQWLQKNAPGLDLIANNRFKGTAEETVTFDPEDFPGIRMDWSYGDITLIQTEEDDIRMELQKTSWGESVEDANQKAEALTVEAIEEKDWKVFKFQQPNEPNALVISDNASQIDVVVYVPEDLKVDLLNWAGTITVEGFRGDLYVDNQFGSTYISDLIGSLSTESDSGVVDLAQIDAGDHAARFISRFGDVMMEDVTAGEVTVESQNGDITITGLIVSGTCEFQSGFGTTTVQGFTCGEFSLKTQNGAVDLENGDIQGDVLVDSDFGSITLTQVYAANYTLESSNGDIKADQVSGEVKVSGGFGDIVLENGVDAILELNNDNGKISYSGSLFSEKNHTITSQFGGVTLRLPEDTSLDIDLKTDFGKINTDFPVTLQGQIDPTSMEGQINGGGAKMTVKTANGDIVLEVQQ